MTQGVNRRRFLVIATAPVVIPLIRVRPAQGGVGYVIFLGVVFIVTEVIIRILQGFQSKVAGSMKEFIHAHKTNTFDAYTPRAVGAPTKPRMISESSRSSTGIIQVGEAGYITEHSSRKTANPIWSHPSHVWAATGDVQVSQGSDLTGARCGYPTHPSTTVWRDEGPDNRRGFTVQQFEGGATALAVDGTKWMTAKDLYEMNKGRQVWYEGSQTAKILDQLT